MSSISTQVHHLNRTISIWHRYDPAVRAELFSTAIIADSGLFFVDPVLADSDTLGDLVGNRELAGIVVTNANHHRAAEFYATEFGISIYAAAEAGLASAQSVDDGMEVVPALTAIKIEGAAAGEIALFHAGDGGTLIVGDALINFGSLGFSFLPAKYCSNQKLMRKSLHRLLDYSFERILFAHGAPIVTEAKTRLATLLDG